MPGPAVGQGTVDAPSWPPRSRGGTWSHRLLVTGLLLIGFWVLATAAGHARADDLLPVPTQEPSIASENDMAVVPGAAGKDAHHPTEAGAEIVEPPVDSSDLSEPVEGTAPIDAPDHEPGSGRPTEPTAPAAPVTPPLASPAVPETPVPDQVPASSDAQVIPTGDVDPGDPSASATSDTAPVAAVTSTVEDPLPAPTPEVPVAVRPDAASLTSDAEVAATPDGEVASPTEATAASAVDCTPRPRQTATDRGAGTGIARRPPVIDDGDETVRPTAQSRGGNTPWHAPFDLPRPIPIPIPIPVPAPAPAAPAGAGCTAASASWGSAGHSGDLLHALAVHDARLAATMAGSLERPASWPAGYPGGGADDPGTSPD
jgi:hypothetical protein